MASIATTTPSIKGASANPSPVVPSPASTFGGSPGSDASGPDTPTDGPLLGAMSGLALADITTYVNPFLREGKEFLRGQALSGSPPEKHGRGVVKSSSSKQSNGKDPNRVKSDWRSASPTNGSDGSSNTYPAGPIDVAANIQNYLDGQFSSATDTYDDTYDDPNVDIQDMGPPEGTVFVANLLASVSDDKLALEVRKVMRKYGIVGVKIKRDAKRNNMPYAFLQFEDPNDADTAVRDGPGTLIFGRACRVERARSHRQYFVERKYGGLITAAEANEVMSAFGKITECRLVDSMERAKYKIGFGVVVEFGHYNAGRKALQSLRHDLKYNIRPLIDVVGTPSSPRHVSPSSDLRTKREMNTMDINDRSIFIGNIPSSSTRDLVGHHFATCGPVMHVTIHTKQSNYSEDDVYTFAFVEFETIQSARRAVAQFDNTAFGDKIIKIAAKELRPQSKQTSGTVAPAFHAIAVPAAPQTVAPSTPPHQLPISAGSPFTAGSPFGMQYPGYGAPPMMHVYDAATGYYYTQYSPPPYPQSPIGYGYSPQYYPYGSAPATGSPTSQSAAPHNWSYPHVPTWGPIATTEAETGAEIQLAEVQSTLEDPDTTPTPASAVLASVDGSEEVDTAL